MSSQPTLLVAGSRNVDAGKTTFSVGLVHRLGAIGLKPRAGNDYWYDYDSVVASFDGHLLGTDARRLAAASDGDLAPIAINPLHRLWRPRDQGTGAIFGRERSEFLVDRVGGEYVVNGAVDIPASVREGLDLADVTTVETLSEMNDLMRDRHRPALEQVRPLIEADRPVVIESYADVARPLQDVDVDAVAVVGAGHVSVFDGDRYCRAAEVASGSADMGRLEERVSDVVDLLDPRYSGRLPPLQKDERGDPAAVARANEAAYDALLAAVE
jgi:predicted P-loop ATPase/GTPase